MLQPPFQCRPIFKRTLLPTAPDATPLRQTFTCSKTPSDYRAGANAIAQLRRLDTAAVAPLRKALALLDGTSVPDWMQEVIRDAKGD